MKPVCSVKRLPSPSEGEGQGEGENVLPPNGPSMTQTHRSIHFTCSPTPPTPWPFSLTPSLSRWERGPRRPRLDHPMRPGSRAGVKRLPSPSEGEGQGEGENMLPLNRNSMTQTHRPCASLARPRL